jgi:hypothetical protein
MSVLGFQLPAWKATIVIALMAIAIIAGLVHWAILARVSRLRAGSGLADRLAPFGFGSWHIGVLHRSWYPDEALTLRRWVLLTYMISLGGVLVAGGLLMISVVFL